MFSQQYDVENFIFFVKYPQQKVHLKTSQKSLFFVTLQHRKFHLYIELSYTKISYLRQNMHFQRDAAFLLLRLNEISENIISPLNGNIGKLRKIWYFLSFSQIFHKFSESLFLMQSWLFKSRQIQSWQFLIYGQNFTKTYVSSRKQKKMNTAI